MFTLDTMNNVGRFCSINGEQGYRKWRVISAVKGYRYLVRNIETGKFLTVSSRCMRSLY